MSQSLGSIYVELSANTAQFVSGLSKAAYVAQQSARDISKEFSSLQRVASQTFGAFGSFNPVISQLSFALSQAGRAAADAMGSLGKVNSALGAIGAIGAGATAAIGSVAIGTLALAMHSAESAARMYELSQSTGVSVEALTGLSFVAKQTGVSAEAMTTGLERMSKSAFAAATAPASAVNAYTRLGVTVKDSAGQMLSTEAIFTQLSGKFAAMADGPAKTALAIQLFGRSGAQLIPVLNQGATAIDRWIATARSLGIVISTETAEKAEKFEQTLGFLQGAVDGVSVKLMADLLPALQTIATALEKAFANPEQVEAIANLLAGLAKDFLAVADTAVMSARTISAFWEATSGVVHPFEPSTWKKFLSEAGSAYSDNKSFLKDLFAPEGSAGTAPTPSKQTPPAASADDGGKKLAEALKSITERLKEEAATAGETSGQIEQYRLKVLGATPAQLSLVAALQQTANAAEIAAGKLGNVKMKPAEESVASLATLRDKYSGLSADGAKWVSSLEQQRLALDALVDAASPFKSNVDLSSIGAAVGAQEPKPFTDVALQQASDAGLRIERSGGKQFGFSENLPQLEDMRTALASVGESTVLVDAAIQSSMDRMVSKIDEAAMHVGTLDERFKGLLGTIAQQGEDLGGKLFDSMSKGIDDISGQLAHLVVTGQSSFKKMFEGLGESVLKSSFQSSFGMLASLALGEKPGDAAKGTLGGSSALASTVTHAFGIKLPGFKRDGSSESSALYVTLTNIGQGNRAGETASESGLLGGITKGLPLSPLSGIASLLSAIKLGGGSSSSSSPFGDFGGSLASGPAAPGGSGEGASILGGLSSTLGAVGNLAKAAGGFSKIFSFFGGFLAGGGDVTPGKSYIVGEKGQEWFTPKQAGTVSPSLKMGGGSHQTTVNMHLHGVQDADSFRRSQTQIYANMHAALSLANERG